MSQMLGNKERLYFDIADKIYLKKNRLELRKFEIEQDLMISDNLLQTVYKDFMNNAKHKLTEVELDDSNDEETNNVLVHMNLLRELIEGKAYDVNCREKEMNDRENLLNERLNKLGKDEVEKYKNLLISYQDNSVYDTESQIKIIKTVQDFDKIKNVKFDEYVEEIEELINKWTANVNNVTKSPGTNSMSSSIMTGKNKVKFNQSEMSNSFMNVEKEHEIQMLNLNPEDNLLTVDYDNDSNNEDSEIKLTLNPEYANKFIKSPVVEKIMNISSSRDMQDNQENILSDKEILGKHTRSSSLPVLPDVNTNNKSTKFKKIIARNTSTPTINNNNIKIKKNNTKKSSKSIYELNKSSLFKPNSYYNKQKLLNLQQSAVQNQNDNLIKMTTSNKIQITKTKPLQTGHTSYVHTKEGKYDEDNSNNLKSKIFTENKNKLQLKSKLFN